MVTQEQVDQFCSLFDGNRTAIGKVWGEQVDCTPERWAGRMLAHLLDTDDADSVGVYPLVKQGDLVDEAAANNLEADYNFTSDLWVKWGCTDLDDGYAQSEQDARKIQEAMDLMDIQGFVERTKGKGYHVWVFADQFVPAEVMRRALLAAHQAAGVRPTEVNPKQTSLDGLKGYGNYVNLPYAASAPSGKRVALYDDWSGDMPLDSFLEEADHFKVPFDKLLAAARLYVEPPKRELGKVEEYDGSLDDLRPALSGLTWTIFTQGPLEGHDRSDTLARLCHKIREDGLSSGQCMTLLRDADRRWGKFYDRPDCDHQLYKLVENAYERP